MDSHTNSRSCACHQSVQEQKKLGSKARLATKALPSVFMSILIAFFPKCPFCWAVYMSMFSSFGLARLPYMSWLLPVLLLFLCVHLLILLKKSARQGYLPFVFSLTGALFILGGRNLFPDENWLLITGMVLIGLGSLTNSLLYSKNIFQSHKV